MGIPLEIIPFLVVYLYFFSGKSLLQSRSQHKTILLQNYVFFTLTYLEGIDSLSLEQKKKKKWKREIGVSKRCWHLTTLIAQHQSPVLDLEIEIFREWWNDLFAKVQMGKIGNNVSGTKKRKKEKKKERFLKMTLKRLGRNWNNMKDEENGSCNCSHGGSISLVLLWAINFFVKVCFT